MSRRTAYVFAALALFILEVLIALFVHDAFVRPYVGDVLATAFVHALLRAVTPLRLGSALAVTLAIALVIELAQAWGLLDAVGLRDNALARTVLGGVFDWFDLLAYAAGAIVIVVVELAMRRRGA